MYSFEDRLNGEALTLRPECTAGVVRGRLWSMRRSTTEGSAFTTGPCFVTSGRSVGAHRQFHQVGAEVLGFAGAEVDAELILLADALWRELGLTGIRLELNSLGQPSEWLAHRAALIAHFQCHAAALDADAQRRLHSNPLRILDSNNLAITEVIETAPRLLDFLDSSAGTFRCLAGHLDKRDCVHNQSASRSGHGLLQLDRVRVRNRSAGIPRHDLWRRSLRLSGRADRRKAGSSGRDGPRRRACARTGQGRGKGAYASGAGHVCRHSGRERHAVCDEDDPVA